jgi:hypothetical protein
MWDRAIEMSVLSFESLLSGSHMSILFFSPPVLEVPMLAALGSSSGVASLLCSTLTEECAARGSGRGPAPHLPEECRASPPAPKRCARRSVAPPMSPAEEERRVRPLDRGFLS